jgi:predicted ribosomally synthesized peptide with SipW-like signal peptide
MIRTQKKKSMTLVLAIILVVVLAVTGTLMLFTAQSETATNVFTVGDIAAALEEASGTYDKDTKAVTIDPADYQVIGHAYESTKQKENRGYQYNSDSQFTGIKFSGKVPGDVIAKAPRVANTGDSTGFYTAVYAKITFEQDDAILNYSEVNAIAREAGMTIAELFAAVISNDDLGENWCAGALGNNYNSDNEDAQIEFYG